MDTQSISERKPLDYLKIIFRRKLLLIIPIVIGIIGGIITANALPKIYQASTNILVEESKLINPLIEGLAVSTSTAQRLAILREQILSWKRMSQLIKSLNLAKDVKNQEQFEELVKLLRKNIKVRLHGRSIISISYEGQNPVEAQNIVKTITDLFIAENLKQQNKETEDAISFINDQLALYQKKLKQSEISAMEDKLNKLLVDSTEKHPIVIELRKKIAIAQGDLSKGNYNLDASTIAGSDVTLPALKEELKQIREELATSSLDVADGGVNRAKLANATNEKLYKLLLLDAVDKVAARDAGVNQRIYTELLQRLESAKITRSLEASKEGTRYIILDPARLPLKPIKPNKLLVLFIGLFLGACVGTGSIFSLELFDHSFLGVDQARASLELPIFGAISKIITQDDLKAQQQRRVKIISISVVTGIILLVAIIFKILM